MIMVAPGDSYASSSTAATDTGINPFQFHASDEARADLRRRITAANWPDGELVSDASQGVPIPTMRNLAGYWEREHDWRQGRSRV